MKSYFRVKLGKANAYAEECLAGHFIGTDYGIAQDLTHDLPDEWREFNKKFIPIFLGVHPDKEKIGAGLACGALWTVSKGIKKDECRVVPERHGAIPRPSSDRRLHLPA